jgi:hypothetical protein
VWRTRGISSEGYKAKPQQYGVREISRLRIGKLAGMLIVEISSRTSLNHKTFMEIEVDKIMSIAW